MIKYTQFTETWKDTLEGFGVFPMGQSRGVLDGFTLTRTVINQGTEQERTSFMLDVTTRNQNDIGFSGHFGFPTAGRENAYDYGYGAGGFIADVPEFLLKEISERTGVNLFDLK